MSKVDDELTRRLQRAERPVDGNGLFEGLARRRSHRERVRRVEGGLLAFAVLAATAGGFVALSDAFDGDGRRVGESPSPVTLPSNGEIVFSREGADGRFHLYAAQPDGSGLRQVTDDATNDTDPAVSPDGRTIAYTHGLDQGTRVIATVPIEGGVVTWQTDDRVSVAHATWSPDGAEIAYIAIGIDSTMLYVVPRSGGTPRCICFDIDLSTTGPILATPTWSPRDARIAFAFRSYTAGREATWDIGVIGTDGMEMETLVASERADRAPAWSPDGARIAFVRHGERGDEVWTVTPDGTDERLLATTVDGSLSADMAWAPDATALLVSDGEWIYRVDATHGGEPRNNFTQIVRGVSPSWQPLPKGSSLNPTPDIGVSPAPGESPSPEPAGHDIGLPFRVCHLHPLTGIDLLGDGAVGTAWTGSRLKLDGTCPSPVEGDPSLLAVDVDGDRQADAFSVFGYCQFCRPFAAVDFDADGDEELALMLDGGSIQSFRVYSAVVAGGEPRIAPILVASPGHPSANHEAGQPLMFSSGGDEGYGAWVRCEGFPGAPVLITTWRDAPIDGTTMEVHETRLVLQADRMFHVVGTTDYEAPVSSGSIPNVSEAPACGVDWQLWV